MLSPGGEILTNNHVIEGATQISATSLADGRTYPVDVIGYDRANDIALVRLNGAGPCRSLRSVVRRRLRSATRSRPSGTRVVSAGCQASPGTVTELGATVRASDEAGGGSRELTDLIRVAADIRPGDSGGHW